MWENVHSYMCAQRRLRSACASAQSDQSLRRQHEDSLHPWLSKAHPVKILNTLRKCAGWSESSLGAHVQSYIFWHCGSKDVYSIISTNNMIELSHYKTNKIAFEPNEASDQPAIRPVWSESTLSAWEKPASFTTHWAYKEDSDHTGRMSRLIWLFTGRASILLFLSRGD